MTIDTKNLGALIGCLLAPLLTMMLVTGVLLAAALALDAFVMRVPGIDGSQTQMLLAALLVFIARQ